MGSHNRQQEGLVTAASELNPTEARKMQAVHMHAEEEEDFASFCQTADVQTCTLLAYVMKLESTAQLQCKAQSSVYTICAGNVLTLCV